MGEINNGLNEHSIKRGGLNQPQNNQSQAVENLKKEVKKTD